MQAQHGCAWLENADTQIRVMKVTTEAWRQTTLVCARMTEICGREQGTQRNEMYEIGRVRNL